MPTKIYLLKDWERISVSTSEYAKIRTKLWNNWFQLLPNENSFSDFTKQWDEQFKIDSLNAKSGPSWIDFVKCINSASVFSIITARWHTRPIIKNTIKEMIKANHNGINRNLLSELMYFFQHQAKKKWQDIVLTKNKDILLEQYLDLAKFYPVSNENVNQELWINWTVLSPELAKKQALLHFINHVRITTNSITHKKFSPLISVGFSDDDEETIKNIKNFIFNDRFQDDIPFHLWSTSSWKVVRHHIY